MQLHHFLTIVLFPVCHSPCRTAWSWRGPTSWKMPAQPTKLDGRFMVLPPLTPTPTPPPAQHRVHLTALLAGDLSCCLV